MLDTLSDIVTRVRGDLNESGENMNYYDDADIKDWIREGQYDVAKKGKHLQSYTDANNVTGKIFNLPDDFIDAHKLLVDDDIVTHIGKENPKGYETWGGNLRLNFELDDAKVELFYFRKPVLMTADTDSPEIPVGHRGLLVQYALFKAKINDRKHDEAKTFYDVYRNDLQDLKKEYGPKPKTWRVKVMRR